VLLFARGESIGRDSTPASQQLLADAAQTVSPCSWRRGCFPGAVAPLPVIVTGSRKAWPAPW
jgi:hypothetical protein